MCVGSARWCCAAAPHAPRAAGALALMHAGHGLHTHVAQKKRPAAAGGGNSASHAISDTGAGAAPAYAFIQISDSEDEDELRNGGAPSSD